MPTQKPKKTKTRRASRKPEWQKKLVLERIERLFRQAEEAFKGSPDRSRRYIQMARRLGMRYNISIPREFRFSYCRKCSSFLKPGKNASFRTSPKSHTLTLTCGICGNSKRFPLKKDKNTKTKYNRKR